MSNLITPVEPQILEAVTGGTGTAARAPSSSSSSSSNDQLLQTLTSISNTIKDLSNTSSKTGFSTTEILMLGLLMNQRSQVNVFVRRPFW
jgi:hypothetical protein